jgi:hypothetical protein
MNNPNMTAKERNLLKGAIRRVFSRSELRRRVIEASIIEDHIDPSRPKVKKWCRCAVCDKPEAKSYMAADHKDPVIPVNSSLESMTWDQLVDRIWCDILNLQSICSECHNTKSSAETKQRAEFKRKRKAKQK